MWGLTADEARDAIFANMTTLHAAATSAAGGVLIRSREAPASTDS